MVVFLLMLIGEPSAGLPIDKTYYVDVIELNHVQWPVTGDNPQAFRSDFDQFIFWQWTVHRDKRGRTYGRHDVVAFRVVRDCCKPRVRFNHARRNWRATWWENGRFVRVIARSYRETTTRFDVEIDQRSLLPKDRRRGLR